MVIYYESYKYLNYLVKENGRFDKLGMTMKDMHNYA